MFSWASIANSAIQRHVEKRKGRGGEVKFEGKTSFISHPLAFVDAKNHALSFAERGVEPRKKGEEGRDLSSGVEGGAFRVISKLFPR